MTKSAPSSRPGAHPGPRNLITDVPGLRVGNAQDPAVRTGVTVIVADRLVRAGVDVAGGGPGTRETDLLNPENLVGQVDAIVLTGGSTWGLGAADGVTAGLGARGRGFQLRKGPGVPPSPLVSAAVLHDLANGGDKGWGDQPPYGALGREALNQAGQDFALGSVGAGCGAVAGALKGGLGSTSIVMREGWTVGAIAAVNSFGSVVGPDGNAFWAAPYEIDAEFGNTDPAELWAAPDAWPHAKADPAMLTSTVIACVATDAPLTTAQCKRVAIMAKAGLARAVRPIFTPFDGDVVFALSTGPQDAEEANPLLVARLGALAADCLARAVARGVYEATGFPGDPVRDWRTRNSI